jgi:hypothetical protein
MPVNVAWKWKADAYLQEPGLSISQFAPREACSVLLQRFTTLSDGRCLFLLSSSIHHAVGEHTPDTTPGVYARRTEVISMTTALQEPLTDVAEEGEEASTPSPYLRRVLEDVERDMVLGQESPKHPTPATTRAPRPFAYD